jgi:putative solute:sodium symporter small subunit
LVVVYARITRHLRARFSELGRRATKMAQVITRDRSLEHHLTPEQREAYWKYNIRLTITLLVIWFVVAYVLGGLLAGQLNRVSFLGFPLGYYIAAQGSLMVFVIEIAVYARLMNKKDLEYGIREEG